MAEEIKPNTFPNAKKLNPLGHLPEYTKNPANFMTIQKALLDTTFCGTTHSDPSQMFECKACQEKTQERRKLMSQFGFRNAGEYMEWRRIQEFLQKPEIREKYKLDKYND
jgi:hypothetical protein